MGVARACAAKVDVVVIGGGVIGMSAAYHLSRADPTRRITIVERGQLGNGATHKSAGMLVSLSGCPYKIRMASGSELTLGSIRWARSVWPRPSRGRRG